ncbi:MAG: DoxX family protein [Nitrosopumilaceae archaeon]|nr:DoxX family protein [Nitrosopumilaceae archaeon]
MEANIRETKLNDITHLGIRLTVGVIFLVHGIGKTANPGFGGFLSSLGLPAEMAPLIALAEIVPGILLIIGVLSRIASSSKIFALALKSLFYFDYYYCRYDKIHSNIE